MNKKLINQIKELPGVESVTPAYKCVVVTFDAVRQAVECGSEDEWEFICAKRLNNGSGCFGELDYEGFPLNAISLIGGYGDIDWYAKEGYQILQFQDYLSQENLQDKYNEFLLEKAKREYPEGTKIKTNTGIRIVATLGIVTKMGGIKDVRGLMILNGHNSKWAEKLKPLFKAEDGVDIYEGDITATVNKENLNITKINTANDTSLRYLDSYWHFSTTEAVEKWVKEERDRRGEKVELIGGKIYYTEWECSGSVLSGIFRYNKKNIRTGYYSLLVSDGCFYPEGAMDYIDGEILKPATKKQIKKLVKAEIKNGFYWDIDFSK